MNSFRYFILNKPFGYLCQFTGQDGDKLLGDLYDFPKDVYSVGRLDKDSEGLLILTNDNNLKTRLLDPESNIKKNYLVQVEGEISDEAIKLLSNGSIQIKHKDERYQVKRAECERLEEFSIEDRDPPIRFRKNVPTSWISLTIREGKNRQVRKMTAAVGFPTLRLIRVGISNIQLNQLGIGEAEEIEQITL